MIRSMRSSTLWVLIIPLLVVVSDCFGVSLQYGDNCLSPARSEETDNSTAPELMCNMKESLSCQNGTCLCKDMSRMTYDPAVGLCVGMGGHQCVYHTSEAHLPNFRKTHCVPYATCEQNVCSCWAAFYLDETGHCARRRQYMQQCRMDFQCDERKGFTCKEGLCRCDPAAATYHPELERCVGNPEQPCVNSYRECVDHYKCKLGKCTCKYKEVQGADGILKCDPVKHKYGKNCGRHRGSCGDELRCVNGKCRCPNPDYQAYDYEQRSCISLVGGPCTVIPTPSTTASFQLLEDEGSGRASGVKNKKNKKKKVTKQGNTTLQYGEDVDILDVDQKVVPCITYARCLPYGTPGQEVVAGVPEMGRCECDKGFIETKKGKCNLPYGAPCDTHSKNKKDICNDQVPLYCVNSYCRCKNELDVYEEDQQRCKRSIGGICWKDGSCVQNARCIRYSPRLPGRCMCPPNAQPDSTSSSCIVYGDEVDASSGYEEEDDIDF